MTLKHKATPPVEAAPIPLEETRVWRFYRGGSQIGRWHGRDEETDGDFPEEWVGSTTSASNPGRSEVDAGLSRLILPSGERPTLLSLIQQMPEFMLGEQASASDSAAAGAGVLVKLLDPCERLPVHAHPTAEFAYQHLGSFYVCVRRSSPVRYTSGCVNWSLTRSICIGSRARTDTAC
jgi:mannose-6-phosphate isomerase